MRAGTDTLIHIRPIISDDREPLQQILEETHVFTVAEIHIALELIDTVLENPATKDYIIRTASGQDNDVLGYYCIGPTPLTVSTYDLYWIAVKPSIHNKGTGSQLLHDAEQLVRSSGGSLIIAETSSLPQYENTRMFYLRNRYQEVARIRNYYKMDDDLVVYGKYLSQQ
jgi:GNAT superfamily N-acetyltransferase